MEKYFVSYTQSLALKELGFNEDCFAYFNSKGDLSTHSDEYEVYLINNDKWISAACSAPLKQQVFKWFRDKHKLYTEINLDSYKEPYSLKVTIKKMDATNTYVEKELLPYANGIGGIDNDKYEEAESACIDKLIEVIKEKEIE